MTKNVTPNGQKIQKELGWNVNLFGVPLSPSCGLPSKVMLIVCSAKMVCSLIIWCQLQLLKCAVSQYHQQLTVDPFHATPCDLDYQFNWHLNGQLLCRHLAYHFSSYQRTETQIIYKNNKSCLKLIMWYSKATCVPSVNDSWKYIARGITKAMDETHYF